MRRPRGRVLLVDDHEMNRNALSRLLRNSGLSVVEADGGRDALDRVGQEAFDLVLLDISMPDLDGLSVLKELRSRHTMEDLPIVMVTARDQSDIMVEAFKLGANDFVTKPIDFQVTLARIDALLARRGIQPAPPRSRRRSAAREELSPAEVREVRIGDRLGSYTITRVLGSGTMGIVYEATTQEPAEHRVALKVLLSAASWDPAFAARFRREARVLARVEHPNVVAVYDVGNQDGHLFMAMQLVEGTTAQHLIRQGMVTWREATRIMEHVCHALEAAHARGIIHRDVKPSNILIALDGSVRLTDFGLAKRIDSGASGDSLTGTGTILGTPPYMSPEQCRGHQVDARSDIYAAGATYYALLTSQVPYREEGDLFDVMRAHCNLPPPDPWDVAPNVPKLCRSIVLRALEKSPDDRFVDAASMRAELEKAMNQ